MKPGSPLMTLDEALERLFSGAQAGRIREVQTVNLLDAAGRILAQPIRSLIDVPPGDNTSMDGYAVRCRDVLEPGTRLPVSQRIPAGQVGSALEPGTVARIFTGAQLPPGADAVVMQEQCEALAAEDGQGLGCVVVQASPQPGQWIRRRGEDVQAGSEVLAAGSRLTPQAMGLAASVGCAEVAVLRRPRVALFSTGDELVMPGEISPEQMRPGAIYNSNRYTLRGLLLAAGCEVTDFGIVPDRLDATRAVLRQAAQGHDLILTSGGVSVGEEDHIKPAVQAEGHLDSWQMAIKPGKPLAFGAGPLRGPAGQPGVEFRDLSGGRGPAAALYAGHVPASIQAPAAARGLQLAQAGSPARVPARSVERAGRLGPIPQSKLGCLDLGGVGRRAGRQCPRRRHCPGRSGAVSVVCRPFVRLKQAS